MPQIGRNDPCPCGSGKKYKNCCLIHDRIAEQRDLSLTPSQARLLTFLYNFARQPRFNQDVVDGFNLYWGGAFDPAAANHVGPENMRRFFEWFVHDYPTQPDKRYIIDLYAEKAVGRLAEEDQALLDAWRASTMGLFRVTALSGEDVLLYDPLREVELTARDSVYSHAALVGDLLIGRRYSMNDVHYLAHMTMSLPAAYESELSAYIINAYRNYGSEQGEKLTWDQFLRTHSALFTAFMLSERGAALRHLVGPGTPYIDPARGREQLSAYMVQLRAERQKLAAEKQENAGARRTASGIILPGAAAPAAAKGADNKEQPAPPRILIPGRDS